MPDTVPPLEDASPPTGECEPISKLARATLRQRTRQTRRLLAKLASGSEFGPELIHKFRVSIRRSEAALLTFRPLLPNTRSRRLRRRLKQLRKLAGELRDVDVLLEQCRAGASAHALGYDLTSLQRSRVRLAKQLKERARREQQNHFKRSIRRIVRRVRWREAAAEPAVAAVAPHLLQPIAQHCLKCASQDLGDLRCLHRFRIHVKRVRYTCEFLETGLDRDACAALLALLTELQQKLGQICDRATTVRLLEQSAAASDAFRAAIDSERQALATVISEFHADWELAGHDAFRRAVLACLERPATSGNLDVDCLGAFRDRLDVG